MKHVRHALAFVMAFVMALAIVTPAIAQEGAASTPKGKITVENAAKGETYGLYKLFDATSDGTHIAYSADKIPDAYVDGNTEDGDDSYDLNLYFARDNKGNITVKEAGKDSTNPEKLNAAAQTALKNWTKRATAVATKTAEGDEVVFDNLLYGYYVLTTTQGTAPAISVDSVNANVVINDKNTTTPITSTDEDGNYKTVNDDDVKVGQEIEYTISFKTASFNGLNRVTKYVITDDFANGKLTNIGTPTVTIADVENLSSTAYTVANWEAGKTGSITIPWVSEAGDTSLYTNGALVTIKYKATVASGADIDGQGNTNTATITFKDKTPEGEDGPGGSETDTATIYTYAVAIQKVDDSYKKLAGAEFSITDQNNKPVFVTKNSDGVYTYAGSAQNTEGTLLDTLAVNNDGLLIVKGLDTGNYTVTETKAPDGYNKLLNSTTVTATKTDATTTSVTTNFDAEGNVITVDANGNPIDSSKAVEHTVLVNIDDLAATPIVVVNNAGATMPSTGGIGTTIFYVVGGVMVAGAVIMLLTKRRVAGSEE